MEAFSTLFDIVKAYDSVDLNVLIRAAKTYQFDMGLMRYILCLYCSPRCLVVDGVATNMVKVSRSILAGDSFADLLLMMVMLAPVDVIVAKYPTVRPTVLAGDVHFLTIDSPSKCADVAAGSANDLLLLMEGSCLFEISNEKMTSVACSKKLFMEVVAKAKRLQGSFKLTVRNLGVQYSACKKGGNNSTQMVRI